MVLNISLWGRESLCFPIVSRASKDATSLRLLTRFSFVFFIYYKSTTFRCHDSAREINWWWEALQDLFSQALAMFWESLMILIGNEISKFVIEFGVVERTALVQLEWHFSRYCGEFHQRHPPRFYMTSVADNSHKLWLSNRLDILQHSKLNWNSFIHFFSYLVERNYSPSTSRRIPIVDPARSEIDLLSPVRVVHNQTIRSVSFVKSLFSHSISNEYDHKNTNRRSASFVVHRDVSYESSVRTLSLIMPRLFLNNNRSEEKTRTSQYKWCHSQTCLCREMLVNEEFVCLLSKSKEVTNCHSQRSSRLCFVTKELAPGSGGSKEFWGVDVSILFVERLAYFTDPKRSLP